MGVPVITLCGMRHGTRFGYSLLKNIGIGELAAGGKDEYIAKAVALAQDKALLTALKMQLRNRMQISPLMNCKSYMKDIQKTYKEIWQCWMYL